MTGFASKRYIAKTATLIHAIFIDAYLLIYQSHRIIITFYMLSPEFSHRSPKFGMFKISDDGIGKRVIIPLGNEKTVFAVNNLLRQTAVAGCDHRKSCGKRL